MFLKKNSGGFFGVSGNLYFNFFTRLSPDLIILYVFIIFERLN